jgi:hypothetical protein
MNRNCILHFSNAYYACELLDSAEDCDYEDLCLLVM